MTTNSTQSIYYLNYCSQQSSFGLDRNYAMFIEGQKFFDKDITFYHEFSDFKELDKLPINVWSTAEFKSVPFDNVIVYFTTVENYDNSDPDFCSKEYAVLNLERYRNTYLFQSDIDILDLREEARAEEEEEEDEYNEYEYDRRTRLNKAHDRDIDEVAYFTEVRKEGKGLQARPAIGIELEVYADNRDEAVVTLRDAYNTPSTCGLLLELDGSLDIDHGFEIITRPFGHEEWELFAPKLLNRLNFENMYASEFPAGIGYGIHVNMHRRHFTPLAEARIFMFLCAEENGDFVRMIAQRESLYNADQEMGTTTKWGQHVSRVCRGLEVRHTLRNKLILKRKNIKGCGKYAPLNLKANILEFRIFQATTVETDFMKNLDFVWALHKWTSVESATGSSWQYQDFLDWLYLKQNRKDYPYLIKFLKSHFGFASAKQLEFNF